MRYESRGAERHLRSFFGMRRGLGGGSRARGGLVGSREGYRPVDNLRLGVDSWSDTPPAHGQAGLSTGRILQLQGLNPLFHSFHRPYYDYYIILYNTPLGPEGAVGGVGGAGMRR